MLFQNQNIEHIIIQKDACVYTINNRSSAYVSVARAFMYILVCACVCVVTSPPTVCICVSPLQAKFSASIRLYYSDDDSYSAAAIVNPDWQDMCLLVQVTT